MQLFQYLCIIYINAAHGEILTMHGTCMKLTTAWFSPNAGHGKAEKLKTILGLRNILTAQHLSPATAMALNSEATARAVHPKEYTMPTTV